MRGRLVSIEGIRGAGKTTLASWLAQTLESRGVGVVQTREPGGVKGDPTGELLRRLLLEPTHDLSPLAETLGFELDRARTYDAIVAPALADERWVLSDRHHFGTIAYQGSGRGVDIEIIDQLTERALGGRYPDRVFLLDLAVADSLQRRKNREVRDRFDDTDQAFEERVRNGFLWAARRFGSACTVIDASQPPEHVQEQALRALVPLLDEQGAG